MAESNFAGAVLVVHNGCSLVDRELLLMQPDFMRKFAYQMNNETTAAAHKTNTGY